MLGRDPYPALKQRRLLRTRQAATVAEIGAWELADARLAALLDGYALSYGLDPRTAPASAALLPYMEQTFGSWYVLGGMRELARAVYERCVARRVEFVFGAEVVRVVEKDGRAAGVELTGGEVAEADRVVLGVRPHAGLVPGGQVWGADDVPVRAGSLPGRFVVLLSLRGAREADTVHRTVVHSADGAAEQEAVFGGRVAAHPTVTVLRPDDPATRPDEAHEAVTLTATVAPQGPVDWTDPAVRQRFADALIERAGAAVPGLRERILHTEIRTPAETEAETGAEGGAVPPPALAGAQGAYLHPGNLTRLPGLHLAGGWSHPGARARARRDVGDAGGRTRGGGRRLPRLAVGPSSVAVTEGVALLLVPNRVRAVAAGTVRACCAGGVPSTPLGVQRACSRSPAANRRALLRARAPGPASPARRWRPPGRPPR
ncbi:hypothetical protein SMICM304S_00877 [Streptomyces microflavus]